MSSWLGKTNSIECGSVGIYRIYNKNTNKSYIGLSTDIKYRLKTHYHNLVGNRHVNPHLQNAVNKHGMCAFDFEILETIHSCTDTELLKLEAKYMDDFSCIEAGYNIKPTDIYGKVRHTKEHREYISSIMRGRKLSNDTKHKLSNINKGKVGRKHTKEHKEHMSSIMKGKKLSNETKKKMSESKKGRPSPNKGKKLNISAEQREEISKKAKSRYTGSGNPRAVSVTDGNVFYGTIKQAAEELGCSRTKIERMLRDGKLRRINGCTR